MAQDPRYQLPTYTPAARGLHWLIALLIFIQLPLGLYMTYRGNEMPTINEKGEAVKGIFDALTGFLYSSHKLIGLTILFLVLARFLYRLMRGAPQPDPSVPRGLTAASRLVHWLMYALLIVVPVMGYRAISYGRYLDVFGIPLPAVTEKNEDLSKEIFEWHERAAIVLLVLVSLHVAAAIYHRFIRKDRVVERMLPKKIA
ncbi:cytochrome B561 [Hyphomicrobium denitrificans 1NES1]|uniref:Cytochrome B561 n=1 Tax=Hyphomicrobium denitrificans 1NES1 TaxID=670307 RepID=N0BD16_9HYPH|nr:cytochrome b [Hyphomicrobium denitrificans]AGK58000.1 cytochrome B561 [Hyphomicrobium denitrificans 1NES1]